MFSAFYEIGHKAQAKTHGFARGNKLTLVDVDKIENAIYLAFKQSSFNRFVAPIAFV